MNLKRLTLALALLGRLVAEAPQSPEAYNRLGKVHQLQGRPVEAESAYRRALDLDPEYIGALIGLGEVEADAGRLDSAYGRFDLAVEIDPRAAEGQYGLGRVLELLHSTGARPVIDSVWEFERLPDAFHRLARGPMGKVLLRVS